MTDLWTTNNDDWPDDWEDDDLDPRLRDLRGQGLTALQLHTIQDIHPAGSYL